MRSCVSLPYLKKIETYRKISVKIPTHINLLKISKINKFLPHRPLYLRMSHVIKLMIYLFIFIFIFNKCIKKDYILYENWMLQIKA